MAACCAPGFTSLLAAILSLLGIGIVGLSALVVAALAVVQPSPVRLASLVAQEHAFQLLAELQSDEAAFVDQFPHQLDFSRFRAGFILSRRVRCRLDQ